MLPAQHWAYSFSIGAEDIDGITNLLLEKETPLSAEQLATEIINTRESDLRLHLREQYEGTKVYRPCESYAVGDRLTFSHLDYATATIVGLRTGQSTDRNPIRIAAVKFDYASRQTTNGLQEFVVEYTAGHPLNDHNLNRHPSQVDTDYTIDDILSDPSTNIIEQVNDALERNPDLVRIAGTWFVRELMVEADIGHLHLAEAVLDMYEGGPLATAQISRRNRRTGRRASAIADFFSQLRHERG